MWMVRSVARVHVRRWLRGIVSRHSPVAAPVQMDGQPLLVSAAWGEASTLPPPTDLPLDSLETLTEPWARQSIEGWYRAHNEDGEEDTGGPCREHRDDGEEDGRLDQANSEGKGGHRRDGQLPAMDEEHFLRFGKQATSLSELDLLDLLDLFDRESVGAIGFEQFVVVIGLLLAVETGAFAPFITQHIAALHDMLTRPGISGPTPTAVIQLGSLVGLADRTVEQSLAQLQLPIAEPITNHGDFGRLLFATLGAADSQAEGPPSKDSKGRFGSGHSANGTVPLSRENRSRAAARGLRSICAVCGCGQRTRGSDYAA